MHYSCLLKKNAALLNITVILTMLVFILIACDFVDTSAPDLHVTADSPAIDAGDNIPASGDSDIEHFTK